MYLDLTGTAGLFGPPSDCSSRILREILEQTGMRPAAAVAGNKLVCKMANRAIRPAGLLQIRAGTEAAYLPIRTLAYCRGWGRSGLLRTAAVTRFREIGELTRLNNGEAPALFGKRGPLLRDTAQGIPNSKKICPNILESV
jgi:DNA polymerase-4